MAKLDEMKEILNSLRLGLSLTIGLLVILVASLIAKEKLSDIDVYFWVGAIIVLILVFVFLVIIKSIVKYTREIKDI